MASTRILVQGGHLPKNKKKKIILRILFYWLYRINGKLVFEAFETPSTSSSTLSVTNAAITSTCIDELLVRSSAIV